MLLRRYYDLADRQFDDPFQSFLNLVAHTFVHSICFADSSHHRPIFGSYLVIRWDSTQGTGGMSR